MANIEGMGARLPVSPIARVMCCPTAFGARSADAVIAGDRWRRSRGLYRCRQRAGPKVSRDRLMVVMDDEHPGYGFAVIIRGTSTAMHTAALAELGPCAQHRFSFINVRRAAGVRSQLADRRQDGTTFDRRGR